MKLFIYVPLLFLFFRLTPAHGGELKIIITSNLKGGFSASIEDQEKTDPMILLGQSINYEKGRGAELYIDLGNAFYPGIIAKYSYGSAVMDFFKYFDCALTLLSTADVRIGINTLEFLQKGNPTLLLSGNLTRKGQNIFPPYFIYNFKNSRIAFVALSSRNMLVDAAEKNIYESGMGDEKIILAKILEKLKGESVSHIILLSGLDDDLNINILKDFKEVDLIMSGADNSGGVMNKRINRIEMHDRRNIIGAPQGQGYYILQLDLGDRINVQSYRFYPAKNRLMESKGYVEFINRLTRWKDHFRKETDNIIANIRGRSFLLNDEKISNLLRDRFNGELSIVRKNSLTSLRIDDRVKQADIIYAINDSYTIFTYRLPGDDIKTLLPILENIVATGIDKGKIQNYEIAPDRFYNIVSTQSVYEDFQTMLKKEIPVYNTWMSINDLVIEDLKGRGVLLLNDYRYLDRRFRATADIALSNYFNRTRVDLDTGIKPPPGKSDKSYRRWGVEDKIDFTVYNSLHQFVLTPYIYYEKEEKKYLHNLMRGTLLYSLNLDYPVVPYHKSQGDTLVVAVHDQKPAVIRETVGVNIAGANIKGKAGVGFEKEVRDPVNAPVYGLEAILTAEFRFFNYLTYKFNLDSFIAYSSVTKVMAEKGQRRIELENAISFRVTEIISIAVKHKWFRYYYTVEEGKYTNSEIVASLDMKTNFKLY